jgi:di/tricarboxylate transporter
VLVYGPGRYRFFDFMRVGGFLTLIVFLVVMVLIPIFWPLRG